MKRVDLPRVKLSHLFIKEDHIGRLSVCAGRVHAGSLVDFLKLIGNFFEFFVRG